MQSSGGDSGDLGKTRGNWQLAPGCSMGPPKRSRLHPGGAGKGREQGGKILVSTRRKRPPSGILHIWIKLGRKKHFEEILKELQPQGRCHQRQWFLFSSRNRERLAEDIPQKRTFSWMYVLCSHCCPEYHTFPGGGPGTCVARQMSPPDVAGQSWPCHGDQAGVALPMRPGRDGPAEVTMLMRRGRGGHAGVAPLR